MDPRTATYEKLGVFYLGKEFDAKAKKLTDDLVLYDSKDLVTHAVIVGMTGSGKTGLGVGLLEEAAIDGIPALIVDPKGDLSNLLLQFPELKPSDFEPWLHADDARRSGTTMTELAIDEAEKWQNGLRDWHQDGDRIRNLSKAVEYTVYTPGSDAGVPISILSSFSAPPAAVLEDGDLLRERIATTATSLLALLGIDADPLRSREHILLTNLLDHVWQRGEDLDLGRMIQLVQNPPFQQVGVIDLESFFPAKERFAFSMSLNNLLAAPGFAGWMRGEPLDIDRLLYKPDGRPRHAIFSIAHLSDAERMFFMSLLLNQTIGWMRSRPGTTSLRAILYIDEIFGYMPPVAEPPSKKPLLTLLKQARAFGVGVVLATQNPVDLDYKGLSNTGTWFIGRLQTERDKERVLTGLEGASAATGDSFDRNSITEILSNLGKRVFLMHNVHEDHPVVFQTRWTLSYLTGPMTRTQIRQLMVDRRPATSNAEDEKPLDGRDEERDDEELDDSPRSPKEKRRTKSVADSSATASETSKASPSPSGRPALAPDIVQVFLPGDSASDSLDYDAQVLALAKIHYVDSRRGLAADEMQMLLTPVDERALSLPWESAKRLELTEDDLLREPESSECHFSRVPSPLTQAKTFNDWSKRLVDYLYRSQRFQLFKAEVFDVYSAPGETERAFRIRLDQHAREERDLQVAKLRQKYAARLNSLQERVRRAELSLDKEAQEAQSSKLETAISFGATILGAFLGRKKISSTNIGRVSTTARDYGRLSKQSEDVRRAADTLDSYREQLDQLEREIAEETQRVQEQFDPHTIVLDTIELKPRKSDIDVRWVALAWVPRGYE